MSNTEIFVVAAARTAVGSFGGALKNVPLADLATTALRAALERSGVVAGEVDHVVMGNVIPTEPRDAYLGRVAALKAGVPKETPAFMSTGCAAPDFRRSFPPRRAFCWVMPRSPSVPARNQ